MTLQGASLGIPASQAARTVATKFRALLGQGGSGGRARNPKATAGAGAVRQVPRVPGPAAEAGAGLLAGEADRGPEPKPQEEGVRPEDEVEAVHLGADDGDGGAEACQDAEDGGEAPEVH